MPLSKLTELLIEIVYNSENLYPDEIFYLKYKPMLGWCIINSNYTPDNINRDFEDRAIIYKSSFFKESRNYKKRPKDWILLNIKEYFKKDLLNSIDVMLWDDRFIEQIIIRPKYHGSSEIFDMLDPNSIYEIDKYLIELFKYLVD